MKKQNRNPKLIVLIILSCAFTIFSGESVRAQNKQPSKVETSESQKWEYCVVSGLSNGQTKDKKATGIVVITFFEEMGFREEYIETGLDAKEARGTDEDYYLSLKKSLAKAFAQLGNNRWEFVGRFSYLKRFPSSPEEENLAFYFKRPKRV